MAQNDVVKNIGVAQENEIRGNNITVGLTTTFANVLVLSNIRKVQNIVIHVGNNDGAISENYKVFTSVNPDSDESNLTTVDWFDKVSSTAISAGGTAEISLTEPYAKIVVQASSASGTPTCSIYYRGYS